MERYGRASEGSQSDPSPEWTVAGGETGLEESVWQLGLVGGESYPLRPDEADCIYYLRTGFVVMAHVSVIGAARTGGGYPERVGQPVCQYYMRTGSCKFGASCKYHHPRQAAGLLLPPVSLNYYGYPLRMVLRPNYLASSPVPPQFHCACAGWGPYQAPATSPVLPSSTPSNVGSTQLYGINQLPSSATAYTGPYQPSGSSMGPSGQ
ncbi:Zinc finger, CCCH-type [Sesbania bispinosa]|nr:Zinc finger, CCCH-type [Sesbania bispinosa]